MTGNTSCGRIIAYARTVRGGGVVLSLLFWSARVAAYVAGVRFDASTLGRCWQFIDPALLRTDLARSIFYLGGQPPLFNLFLGFGLKLGGENAVWLFQTAFLLLGWALCLALYFLLARLKVAPGLRGALTALFAISPDLLLYENYLFYELPTALLLVVAASRLHAYLQRERTRDGLAFFACLAALVLLRSLFSLLWFLIVIAALLLARRIEPRRLLAAALLPLLLAVGWYAKNYLVFGEFTGSTWFGLNLSRVITANLPREERLMLAQSGQVSPLVLIHPFNVLTAYQNLVPLPPPTGVPLLDQPTKSTGAVNFHHLGYVAISRQYGRDALRLFATHPAADLANLRRGYLTFFYPPSRYPFVERNRQILGWWDQVYHLALCGCFGDGLAEVCWFDVVGYAAILVVVMVLAWRARRFPDRDAVAWRWTVGLLCFNVLFVVVVGNAAELGENNRFRLLVIPQMVALAGVALMPVVRRSGKPRQTDVDHTGPT